MVTWPNQEYDLQIAQDIIDKYVDINGGDTLELVEYVVGNRLEISSKHTDLLDEIQHSFEQIYGKNRGLNVMHKVLTYCVIDGATIH